MPRSQTKDEEKASRMTTQYANLFYCPNLHLSAAKYITQLTPLCKPVTAQNIAQSHLSDVRLFHAEIPPKRYLTNYAKTEKSNNLSWSCLADRDVI